MTRILQHQEPALPSVPIPTLTSTKQLTIANHSCLAPQELTSISLHLLAKVVELTAQNVTATPTVWFAIQLSTLKLALVFLNARIPLFGMSSPRAALHPLFVQLASS